MTHYSNKLLRFCAATRRVRVVASSDCDSTGEGAARDVHQTALFDVESRAERQIRYIDIGSLDNIGRCYVMQEWRKSALLKRVDLSIKSYQVHGDDRESNPGRDLGGDRRRCFHCATQTVLFILDALNMYLQTE